jgi:hypothetical protein
MRSVEKAKARCWLHRTPACKTVSHILLRIRHGQYDNIILSNLVKGYGKRASQAARTGVLAGVDAFRFLSTHPKAGTTPRLMDATINYRGGRWIRTREYIRE